MADLANVGGIAMNRLNEDRLAVGYLTQFMPAEARRCVLIAGALVLIATGCDRQADEPAPESTPAEPAFLTPRHINVGEVLPSAQKKIEYTITATDDDYEVEEIRASCGCTKPVVESTQISQGSSTKVVVDFHGPSRVNSFRHSFVITLRGEKTGKSAEVVGTFEGRAEWPISASPSILSFGEVVVGTTLSTRINLRGSFLEQLRVESVNVSEDANFITVAPQVIPEQIKLLVNPPLGQFSGIVRVQTNCAGRPEIVVPVKGIGISESDPVSPSALSLGIVPVGQIVARTIVIKTDFRPVSVSFAEDAGWRARVLSIKPANSSAGSLVRIEFDAPETTGIAKTVADLVDDEGNAVKLPVSVIGVADKANRNTQGKAADDTD